MTKQQTHLLYIIILYSLVKPYALYIVHVLAL